MKVLSGDFGKNKQAAFGAATGKLAISGGFFSSQVYTVDQIEMLEEVSEENKASVAGKLGWGAAGAVAFGGLGLLAGVLAGGNRNKVVFAVQFKDGKRALIECSRKEFTAISAATF